MKIEYSSNNSGGRWWLSDDNWRALEAAGWKVYWHRDQEPLTINGSTPYTPDADGRWLGALAKKAVKDFESVGDAIAEWERITGMEASDEGCNCCGAPHTFYWGRAVRDFDGPDDAEYGYCSGEDCLTYMFKEVPKSLREATEALSAKKESLKQEYNPQEPDREEEYWYERSKEIG